MQYSVGESAATAVVQWAGVIPAETMDVIREGITEADATWATPKEATEAGATRVVEAVMGVVGVIDEGILSQNCHPC